MLAPGALVHPCPGDRGCGGPRGPGVTGPGATNGATGGPTVEAGKGGARGGELDEEEDLEKITRFTIEVRDSHDGYMIYIYMYI